MDINLKLRSKILEYSLNIEESINDLLLANLGIFDDGKLKLFGGKVGISFKNKIDLLYDINVLSKEENSDFELMMIFRNKFLHDIECNSFLCVLEQLDNGLKNKFKYFLNEGHNISNEESCETAYLNLYLKNIRTIQNKAKAKRIKIEERHEIFKIQNKQTVYYLDSFFNLINDLLLIIENAELEDKKVRILSELISEKCQQYINKIKEDKEIISLNNKINLFFSDIEKLKDFYGIRRIDNNKIINFVPNNVLIERIDNFRKKLN